MDERFLQHAGSLRKTLLEDIDQLLQQQAAGHSPSPSVGIAMRDEKSSTYSCYTRLARLDFPRFNGDGIKNWLVQCETFFRWIILQKISKLGWLWYISREKHCNGTVLMLEQWD